ncbi:SGNH/GDSL hydrolase family protein [Winogradskyella psychrotolerans]|uniref:SGNH/GDSL hydrolase family protein n=1 Tax=Winogradskyella psychrotolerans TaxID=1344585 RepID=UPI001C06AFAF|nr:SGNH/GDSL hydrolase family protein [Winogradskyella psychrotolerans]MBU2926757.1 SGNH/GDSL hydrolase family protein [Winogradskyella psychrotolerans]
MKSTVFILIFVLTLVTSCKSENKSELDLVTKTLPLHHKRVLILGNSITQHGHYVDFIEYYLRKQYTDNQLDIISIGLSGETISGTSEDQREYPRPNVRARLDSALAQIKPDIVIACYGMNDGNYNPIDPLRFQAYKDGILELKTKVDGIGAQLILMTPTVFDADPIADRVSKDGEKFDYWHPYYKYNEVLEAYANWLLSIETDDLRVIDLHHPLDSLLDDVKRIKSDSTFIPDGVHPNKIGHLYMAQTILNNLYPNIIIEHPASEIKRLEADSLYYFVSKRRELRSEGWRHYIGYIKNGDTVKSDDISSTKAEVQKIDIAIAQFM